jgi:hypothetical protein
MKNHLRLIIFGCLLLTILVPVTGCNTSTSTSSVTTDKQIIIEPSMDDTEGDIHFENVTITSGILDRDYEVMQNIPFPHQKGDPCYLITGQIKNNSSTRYWVAHRAYGYDKNGNEVSFPLGATPFLGIAQIGIEPYSSENFTLHVSWSDNTTSFKVFSQKSANMFP